MTPEQVQELAEGLAEAMDEALKTVNYRLNAMAEELAELKRKVWEIE